MKWMRGVGRWAIHAVWCIVLFSWSGTASATSDLDCTETSDMRIRIGSTALLVPRHYAPKLAESTDEYVRDVRTGCQHPSDPEIEAQSVAFALSSSQGISLRPTPDARPLQTIQVEVIARPQPFTAPIRSLDSAVKLIEQRGHTLEALPHKNGFIAFDQSARSPHIYVAEKDSVEARDSVPLVIECSAREYSSPDNRHHFGRACRTTYYSVTDGLAIRYKFYDDRYPINTWTELDSSVRGFVRSLVKED